MSEELKEFESAAPFGSAPSIPRVPTTAWLISRITRRPGRRILALGLIGSMIAIIALTDIVAGAGVSLQIFCLVPIILAAAWFGWRSALLTGVVCALARSYLLFFGGTFPAHPKTVLWNRFIDLAVYCLVIWIIHALLSLQRNLEDRVSERTRQLEASMATRDRLQRDAFESASRERSTVGRELHDGLGQHLTAIAFAAELLAERLAPTDPEGAGEAREIATLVQQGVGQTRQIARGLLLSDIEPDHLIPELEELAAKTSRQAQLPCRLVVQGSPPIANREIASHLYRIAQEAVRNAVRHARPRGLVLTLSGGKPEDPLTLTVIDDGVGIPETLGESPGLGLKIMKHRAGLIGGDFGVERIEGGGTRVVCRLRPPAASRQPASP